MAANFGIDGNTTVENSTEQTTNLGENLGNLVPNLGTTTDPNRRRTHTEGSAAATAGISDIPSAANPLRFLERLNYNTPGTSSSSLTAGLTATSPSSLREGYGPPPVAATLPRGSTVNSPYAFLERRNPGADSVNTADGNSATGTSTGTAVAAVIGGAGADGGLGSLSGGVMAAGAGPGGFLPNVRDRGGDSSDDEDESDDDNVCPSMLFSCFPCLACFRPGKRRRRSTVQDRLEIDVIKSRSRSQTSLTTPLLSDQQSTQRVQFPNDVKLLEVEVESAKDVPEADSGWGTDSSGTYVSLRMTPVQQGVGEQTQQTSLARKVANPRWGHRENFTFFLTDTRTSAKAFLSLYLTHRPGKSPPAPSSTIRKSSSTGSITGSSSSGALSAGALPGDVVLAEGFVDLLALFPTQQSTYTNGGKRGNSRRIAVPMRDPVIKRRTRCAVMLGIRCRRVNESIDTREDRLYEYQRWTPLTGWSPAGDRDPGKWSTLDGSVFSDTFAGVAPPPREDSEVVLPWCPFGGWEYSREEHPSARRDEDTDGARTQNNRGAGDSTVRSTEALSQKNTVWMEGYAPGFKGVRRRLWRRVYLDRGSSGLGQHTAEPN